MNVSLFLQMAAEACPERRALTANGQHYTYAQLFSAAKTAAVRILDSGCSHVVLVDVSSPAVVIALFGAAFAGLPYVPLNYRLASAELQKLMGRVTPAYVIAGNDYLSQIDATPRTVVIERNAFLASLADCDHPLDDAPIREQPVAIQLFTSGTTGEPKAAILKHENLVSYILGSVEFMSAAEEESSLISVPPYHIAGISAILSSVYGCRRQVQLANFSPEKWLRLCAEESVTQAFLVPTMLTRIIGAADDLESGLTSLRAIAYGGGKMPLEVINKALKRWPNIDFTNAYGLTETSSTISLLGPEDHRAAQSSTDVTVQQRLASVGKPLPSIEVQIRDESGNVLPAGAQGEIHVRGPQVSGEYLEKIAVDAHGWFPTRDAGYLDTEGYLYLSGRIDDVIVRGGENISPGEIEDLLLFHPAVADAGVVGIPSEEWGEAVAAVVVLVEGESCQTKELQSMIKNELRSSRVPEKLIFAKELPYNDMGKLLRRELKGMFE